MAETLKTRMKKLLLKWRRRSLAMVLVGQVAEARAVYECECDLREALRAQRKFQVHTMRKVQ